MRLIIAGGRDFGVGKHNLSHWDVAEEVVLENYLSPDLEIVSGGANGADHIGEEIAKKHDIPVKVFPANWGRYGKSAGYRRNVEMANYADSLIAFWDGKSKGTKHMIDIALDRGLLVKVINY